MTPLISSTTAWDTPANQTSRAEQASPPAPPGAREHAELVRNRHDRGQIAAAQRARADLVRAIAVRNDQA